MFKWLEGLSQQKWRQRVLQLFVIFFVLNVSFLGFASRVNAQAPVVVPGDASCRCFVQRDLQLFTDEASLMYYPARPSDKLDNCATTTQMVQNQLDASSTSKDLKAHCTLSGTPPDADKAQQHLSTLTQNLETKSFTDIVGGIALSALMSVISFIVGALLALGSMIFDVLFVMITDILLQVVKFNNFTEIPQIVEVWKVMRDLANMFFIVVVLVIAFGTMLRLEKYEWKHLLPKLVFAALFINFSRAICGVIIDISQVVMLTFVNAFKDAGIGNFQHLFSVTGNLFKLAFQGSIIGFIKSLNPAGGGAEASITVMILIFLSFGYLVTAVTTMFTMLGLLIFRIVALWILVMMSPIAFVLFTFPEGEEYANKWLQQFTANVLVGPVMAFFIWLALLVNQASGAAAGAVKTGQENGVAGALLETVTKGGDKWKGLVTVGVVGTNFELWGLGKNLGLEIGGALDPKNFLNMILSVTILGIGMSVANELGSAGAEMVKGAAEHITGAGKWMAGGALATTDRIAANVGKTAGGPLSMLSYITPKALKGGYEKFRHKIDHDTYSGAEGKIQDTLHEMWNPTLGFGRGIADARDKRIDKDTQEKIEKVKGNSLLNDKEKADKISDINAAAREKKQTLAFLRFEGISGRTGKVFQKIEEEKSTSEFASELAATNYTAEQLAQIYELNKGNGNVEMMQAFIRAMVTGNNGDDHARIAWLTQQKELLSNNGGRDSRLMSEFENAIVQIQTQSADRDRQRSARAGPAKDWDYEHFEADKNKKLGDVDDRVKSKITTEDDAKIERDTIEKNFVRNKERLFDGNNKVKSEYLKVFATKSDAKKKDPITGKDTIEQFKNPTIASQVDLYFAASEEVRKHQENKDYRSAPELQAIYPVLEAIVDGYSNLGQHLMGLVPPEGKRGKHMTDLKTFAAKEQHTLAGATGIMELLEKLKDVSAVATKPLPLLDKKVTDIATIFKNGLVNVQEEVLHDLREQLLPMYTEYVADRPQNKRKTEQEEYEKEMD